MIIAQVQSASAIALNPIDAGAQMITKGIDAWFMSQADSMVNASRMDAEPQSALDMVVMSVLTYNYDPFKDPYVLKSRDMTALIYLILVMIFMLTGAAYVYIHTASSSASRDIDWIFGGNFKYFHLNNYLKSIVMAIVFVAGAYLGYWMLIMFNNILSVMVLSYTLDSIIPRPDSFVLYMIMAFATLLLALFMAWRVIIIGLGASYILVIAGLYLYGPLKEIAVKVFIYIVIMIFSQVILISIAGGGVMIIQNLPLPDEAKHIFYNSLVLGLLLTAFILFIGPAVFLLFMKQGTNVIKLVV